MPGADTDAERRPPRKRRPVFLRWALVNSLATVAFLAAALSYHGQIHTPGRIAAGLVLTVFVAASAYCGVLAWRADETAARGLDERSLEHVALAIRICPMLAMPGTASGFSSRSPGRRRTSNSGSPARRRASSRRSWGSPARSC